MIISCEKCSARYLLTLLLLGDEGRNVRCGVCGHTWFQEPEPIETLYDGDEDSGDGGEESLSPFQEILDREALEPIPEGVRPIPEGSAVPAISPVARRASLGRDTVNGFLAAVAVFILFSTGLVVARNAVVHVWPPSALLFEVVGLPVPVPGEGLVFDKMTTTLEKDGTTLTLRGDVINLQSHESSLPVIQATLRKSGEDQGKSLVVAIDKKTIGPEETIPFTTTFDQIPNNVTDVSVRFVAR